MNHTHTGLDATICLDDLTTVDVARVQTGSDGKPFLFVRINDVLAIWTHDPTAFRRLGSYLMDAADKLSAAQSGVPPRSDARCICGA